LIVSIHQPAYLPWLGYLDRIAASDAFIYLDTVQFEKNSFINRNRIKTRSGPLWLTVPVLSHGHQDRTLLELRIDNRQHWKKKHLRSIEQNYRRAPYFNERFTKLLPLYDVDDDTIVDLCFQQLRLWTAEFGLKARIIRASELNAEGRKSNLVLALCELAKARIYLSGPQGRDYLDVSAFASAGIEVRYHDFVPRPYPQLFGEFVPAMAALDYWMNVSEPALFRRGL
jgi:hypothetical protein